MNKLLKYLNHHKWPAASILLTLLLALMILLPGCGNDGFWSTPTSRVMIMHDWDETKTAVLEQLINDFKATHPDVNVILASGSSNEIKTNFADQARLGLGPDILIGSSSWVRDFAAAGLLRDIDAQIEVDPARYLSTAIATVRYQDKLYGLPLAINTYVLYYNRTMIDAPPETLDRLVGQINEGNTFAMDIDFEPAFWGVQAFGGQLFDDQGRVVLNQGGFVNWLGWLKNLSTSPYTLLESDGEALRQLFVDGRVALYVGRSTEMPQLREALGEDVVGVAPLPAGPNGAAGPFLSTDALLFNAYSSPVQAELALELAQFMTNAAQQAKLMRQTGLTPINLRVRVNNRIYPGIATLLTQSRTAVPLLNVPQMDDLSVLGSRTYVEALSGATGLNEAAATLTDQINQKYNFDSTPAAVLNCPIAAEGRLRVWHAWSDEETVPLREITRNFMRRCPGIVVSLTSFAPDTLYDEYRAAVLEGQGPDLLLGVSNRLASLADEMLITDLTGLVDVMLLQQYLPVSQALARYEERLYGLPLSLELMALYYNADQVSDPARQLEDLLTQVDADRPAALPINSYEAFWGLSAFGGLTFSAENGYEPRLDTAGMQRWLEWLQTVSDRPGFILDEAYEPLLTRFAAGQAAYLAGHASSLSGLQARLGAERLLVTPLPAGPEGEAGPIVTARILTVNTTVLNSVTQTDLALAFAAFATNAESQTLLMEQAHHVPSNINVDTTPQPAINGFLEQTETAVPLPNRLAVNDIEIEVAGDALYQAVFQEDTTPAQAIVAFSEQLDQMGLEVTALITNTSPISDNR